MFSTVRQLPKEFYDDWHTRYGEYSIHPKKSKYFPLWNRFVAITMAMRPDSIVELGCGTGQLAKLLYEEGYEGSYTGYDFSYVAVKAAKKKVPNEFNFRIVDLVEEDFEKAQLYIACEFLEHVEKDWEVLLKIPIGAWLLASVPPNSKKTHVRWFRNFAAVCGRYEWLIKMRFLEKIEKHWFLFYGERR